MEKSTSMTFLFHKVGDTFSKLVDITSYPDLFVKPEKLDVSDLSSNQKKYVPGMVDLPDYDFGFNYSKEAYAKVKALEGKSTTYQLRFGANGEFGIWQWDGDIFVTPTGGAVGAARTGTITVYPATNVTEVDDTAVTISPLSDTSVAVAGAQDITVSAIPADATITAVSGTTAKATVSVSGSKITLTGVAAGTSVITVTAAKAGLASATTTFTVTVTA